MDSDNLFTINPLSVRRRLGVYTFSAVLLLVGVFSFREDLKGKELPDVVIATEETLDIAGAESLAVGVPFVPPVPPESAVEAALRNPHRVRPLPPDYIDAETLWLARIIYSETKRLPEQELVAWVVRNRVDTAYRGKRTYKDVALDPYQFSAFNPDGRKRHYYMRLDSRSKAPGWQKAMTLAYYVRHAPERLRPFSHQTRHFYSERSLSQDVNHPEWTQGMQPVTPRRKLQLDARRFRFYEGVI